MRKRDPNALIDQFQADLTISRNDRKRLCDAAPNVMLARRATMDAFARTAVSFERFRSEWHIAAITRDAREFADYQRRRVEVLLKGNDKASLLPYVSVNMPKHPTLEQVASLLDASGSNLSTPSVDAWKDLAKRDLAEPWRAQVVDISWSHSTAANAVIAIRNAVSHQSSKSLTAMSVALEKLTHPHHAGLQRPQNNVSLSGIPIYLHGSVEGVARIEKYYDLLRDLVEDLRVPS